MPIVGVGLCYVRKPCKMEKFSPNVEYIYILALKIRWCCCSEVGIDLIRLKSSRLLPAFRLLRTSEGTLVPPIPYFHRPLWVIILPVSNKNNVNIYNLWAITYICLGDQLCSANADWIRTQESQSQEGYRRYPKHFHWCLNLDNVPVILLEGNHH